MHLPYKSVTGRHTYVIYLMFFNIHAYLGFIQFIKFSVWPAEMGKIKADVNALPPFKCSPTSCKAWNQLGNSSAATTRSLPWLGPSLLPRGSLTLKGSAAESKNKISSKKSLRPDWKPGRHFKGHRPHSGDEKQDGGGWRPSQTQSVLNGIQVAMCSPLFHPPRSSLFRNPTAF